MVLVLFKSESYRFLRLCGGSVSNFGVSGLARARAREWRVWGGSLEVFVLFRVFLWVGLGKHE